MILEDGRRAARADARRRRRSRKRVTVVGVHRRAAHHRRRARAALPRLAALAQRPHRRQRADRQVAQEIQEQLGARAASSPRRPRRIVPTRASRSIAGEPPSSPRSSQPIIVPRFGADYVKPCARASARASSTDGTRPLPRHRRCPARSATSRSPATAPPGARRSTTIVDLQIGDSIYVETADGWYTLHLPQPRVRDADRRRRARARAATCPGLPADRSHHHPHQLQPHAHRRRAHHRLRRLRHVAAAGRRTAREIAPMLPAASVDAIDSAAD